VFRKAEVRGYGGVTVTGEAGERAYCHMRNWSLKAASCVRGLIL
jgi:hypothetical protein